MGIGWRMAPQNLVYAGFAVYSFGLGNIFPRLPDIQHAMAVEEGALGLGLIGTPVGTLVALTFATPLIERIGFRRSLLAAIPLMAAGFALAVHAPDPLAFFLLLLPVGLLVGSIEIILNVEADRTEALVGRRIMNRAHSFWSFGFFGAGLAGGTLAQAGLSPQMHLALMVPVSMLGGRAAARALPAGATAAGGGQGRGPALRPPHGRDPGPRGGDALGDADGGRQHGLVGHLHARGLRLGAVPRRAGGGDLRLLPGGDAVLRRRLRRPALAEHGGARAPLRDDGGGGARLLLALALRLARRLRAPRGRDERDLPAGDLGRGAAHGPAGRDQRRGAGADLLRHLPASGPPLLGFVAQHWGIRWSFGIGLPLVAVSLALAGSLGRKHRPPRKLAEGRLP